MWLPAAHDGWVPQPLTDSGWREHSYGGFGEGTRISTRMTLVWVRV